MQTCRGQIFDLNKLNVTNITPERQAELLESLLEDSDKCSESPREVKDHKLPELRLYYYYKAKVSDVTNVNQYKQELESSFDPKGCKLINALKDNQIEIKMEKPELKIIKEKLAVMRSAKTKLNSQLDMGQSLVSTVLARKGDPGNAQEAFALGSKFLQDLRTAIAILEMADADVQDLDHMVARGKEMADLCMWHSDAMKLKICQLKAMLA